MYTNRTPSAPQRQEPTPESYHARICRHTRHLIRQLTNLIAVLDPDSQMIFYYTAYRTFLKNFLDTIVKDRDRD